MKHLVLILVGIGIAAGVAFVFFSHEAGQPSPSTSPTAAISVDKPLPGAVVSGTEIIVSGKARTFEQTVNWRLRTGAGTELANGFTTATAQDIGVHGDFSFTITVPDNAPNDLSIEVFEFSAENGQEIHKVTIPVTRQ